MSIATKFFYKYTGVINFHHVVDVLINQRLHACSFDALNDPMEGSRLLQFLNNHAPRDSTDWNPYRHAVSQVKICSLSKDATNSLLWSLYSDAHRGVCFKVSLRNSLQAEPVVYREVDLRTLALTHEEFYRALCFWKDSNYLTPEKSLYPVPATGEEQEHLAMQGAKRLFTRKDACWSHEEEERVFSASPFVPVQVHEVIFGVKMDPAYKNVVNDVLKMVNAAKGWDITSRTMEREMLNSS